MSQGGGQRLSQIVQADLQASVAHTASIAAGQTASLYAHQGGLQVKAANGPVSLRARTDELKLLADQSVTITSVNDEIRISANSMIELIAGQSGITLEGGNITVTTPGSFAVKGATHGFLGGGSRAASLPALPEGAASEVTPFIEVTFHDDALKPMAGYQKALGEYEGVPTMSPLGLDQLGDYERCMQLMGLCYLLHRRDLLPRIAQMIDPGYRGEDTLYEDLLSFVQAGRTELDEWYHGEPYTPLVRAMYEQDKSVAADLLKQYCEEWYPAFKYVPWHDGHRRINGTDGAYFGYWAFEAGAVALLCDIDDSAITHMVYPKDLVAWARQHTGLSETPGDGSGTSLRLRCEAGQPCPKTGFWFTPARAGSRQRFEAGQVMPEVGGDYGTTLWQWDEMQG